MYVAILAGGVGTRLWPRSRQDLPKQFADITGCGRTMIQETVQRLDGFVDDDQIYVITRSEYRELAMEQLPMLPQENFICEPYGRNTAPAIGLTCIHLRHRDPDAVVAFLPADHIISDVQALRSALRRAEEAAGNGHIVTLGIEPTLPHTGYGYIRRGQMLLNGADPDLHVYAVEKFLEKPDLLTAQRFLFEGKYFWNGGMFISQASRMLDEIERQIPDAHACLEEIRLGIGTPSADSVLANAWERMPSISIDFGVMEGAENVSVVPLRAGWSDVGSWDAVGEILDKDPDGNCVVTGDLLPIDSHHNVIYSTRSFVSLIGVEDLVIVDSKDALLIGHKDQMQKVAHVVDHLRKNGRSDLV